MSPHIFVSDMKNNILSTTFWLSALDDLSYVKIILLHNNLDMWRYDALKCIDGRTCFYDRKMEKELISKV